MPYRLTHPDSAQEIEVNAAQVPLYQSQGWQTKPGAKPVSTPPTPAPTPDPDTQSD